MVDTEKTTTTPETKEQEKTSPDLSGEEKDLTSLKTNVDEAKLKTTVESTETTDKTILKYIEWSAMYTKLQALDIKYFTVEKFAEEINTTVETYLRQVFKKSAKEETLTISDTVLSSLSIGIQFSMMEALTKSWADGADFFSAFSKTDTDDASSTFTGLTKAFSSEWFLGKVFGGMEKTNEFYSLASKVQNSMDFVSRYCGEGKELGDGSKVLKLANPNEFRKMLADTTRSDDSLLLSKTPKDFWLTLSDEDITAVPVDKNNADYKELFAIVDDANMPINEKTIQSIMKALPTAQKFLEKRTGYKKKAIDLMSTVAGFLDVNIFGLWTIGGLLGITNPLDLIWGKKKKWWLANFVLKAMGFHDGLNGLYQEYIRQSIDNTLTAEGKTFIKSSLKEFSSLVAASTYAGTKTLDVLGLATLEKDLDGKVPTEYDHMKSAISTYIKGKDELVNAAFLKSLGVKVSTEKDATDKKKDIVKSGQMTETVVDTYLKKVIPTLISNADFMAGVKSEEEFFLAISWGLVSGTCFAWGVALGLETLAAYKEEDTDDTTTETTTTGTYEDIDETDPELVRLASWPNEDYSENKTFVKYLHALEAKNTLPYGIMLNLMKAESGGKLYKDDGVTILWSTVGAQWLFQFMPGTAKWYITKLWYEESEYEKIFTNPIIGAKACAMLLKSSIDDGKDTVNALACYNRGAGGISSDTWGKGVDTTTFANIPNETQRYVLKIWYTMLEYSGKSTIIEKSQIQTPSSVSKEILSQFFVAVNAIAAPTALVAASDESVEDPTEENYKENTMFVGDSITVGYAQNLKYRYFKEKMWGKTTERMDTNFSEAVDADPKPKTIVILWGINDLCNYALLNEKYSKNYTAQDMCDAIYKHYASMQTKAKAAWIHAMIWTITPFNGFLDKSAYAAQKPVVVEAIQLITAKIKKDRPENAIIDFRSQLEDSDKSWYLAKEYWWAGDGSHLNLKGYQKMQEIAFAQWKKMNTPSDTQTVV